MTSNALSTTFDRSGTWKEQDWKIGEKEVGEKYVDGSLGTGTPWEDICILCILPEDIYCRRGSQ